MRIVYNAPIDLLYMRLDEQQQDVINKQVAEGFMLDLGKGNKIIGIEILDACLLYTSPSPRDCS